MPPSGGLLRPDQETGFDPFSKADNFCSVCDITYSFGTVTLLIKSYRRAKFREIIITGHPTMTRQSCKNFGKFLFLPFSQLNSNQTTQGIKMTLGTNKLGSMPSKFHPSKLGGNRPPPLYKIPARYTISWWKSGVGHHLRLITSDRDVVKPIPLDGEFVLPRPIIVPSFVKLFLRVTAQCRVEVWNFFRKK